MRHASVAPSAKKLFYNSTIKDIFDCQLCSVQFKYVSNLKYTRGRYNAAALEKPFDF